MAAYAVRLTDISQSTALRASPKVDLASHVPANAASGTSLARLDHLAIALNPCRQRSCDNIHNTTNGRQCAKIKEIGGRGTFAPSDCCRLPRIPSHPSRVVNLAVGGECPRYILCRNSPLGPKSTAVPLDRQHRVRRRSADGNSTRSRFLTAAFRWGRSFMEYVSYEQYTIRWLNFPHIVKIFSKFFSDAEDGQSHLPSHFPPSLRLLGN